MLNRISWCITACILFFTFIFPSKSFSQENSEFEEISISLIVQGIGATEIPALIRDYEIYLPVNTVFDFLKIRNVVSPGMDLITGFFITPEADYAIDRELRRILFLGRVYNLAPDELVRTETNLYLKSNYFGEVFGLECKFSFRSLSVELNAKTELPAIREMRMEQMRKNLNRLKGEVEADTVIGREYPLFHFGMVDWLVNSTQQFPGRKDTRLNLAMGGIIAGGETKIAVSSYLNQPFNKRQLNYLWRYADNNNPLLRQVMAGKIMSQATSTLYSPFVGVQFTNTPTTYRRSFGNYTLSNYTEPGWVVELYVNNVLVDYVKADASGFFTFEVPLVYGNTELKLRFYGPWGEEHTSEQNIRIPYNFLPPEEFEYTVNAGMVEDESNSLFSRTSLNYGLSRDITIGGGLEHYSMVTSGKNMPFLNSSLSLTPNLLFSGEYMYGVRSRGILNYRLPSNLQFELIYIKYAKDQKAINTNAIVESKILISMPIRLGNFTLFSRFNLGQIVSPVTKHTMADLLLSGAAFGIGANLTANALFSERTNPYINSSLALSFRLPHGYILRPQTQYDFHQRGFSAIRCELEKQFFGSINMNAVYEKNFINNSNNFQIGIRYELPFAQTGFSASRSINTTTLTQAASGSLMFDAGLGLVGANNRISVGKGGVVILTYLDFNGNGKRDKYEPKAAGLRLRINGGRIENNMNDTTIVIYDLEPYAKYFIELNKNSFDNIAWQVTKNTISVEVSPNQIKLIEIPVSVFGEVSGMVYFDGGNEIKGLGRIIVNFFREDNTFVARTLTESDGYFNFLGLTAGLYTARIDASQLRTLKMNAEPIEIPFEILPDKEGDIVDGLEFNLKLIPDSSFSE